MALTLVGVAGVGSLRGAAAVETCMDCHADSGLTLTRDGREVSLFVDAARYAASQHAGFACLDCHAGLDGDAIPHAEPVQRVNCFSCHAGMGESHQFHPGIGVATEMVDDPAVNCSACHGTHEILATADPLFSFAPGRRTESCGACHEPEKLLFTGSAHHGGNGAPFPDCVSCHQTDVVGGANRLEMKTAQLALCLSCHVDTPEAARRTGLAGRFVASWGNSVHGKALQAGNADAANCIDCHGSHEMKRGMLSDSRVNKLHIIETCQTCHEKEAADYSQGAHAAALSLGIRESPVCTDCHGEHLILGAHDPLSPVSARNVSQQLCGDCHGSVKLSQKYGISSDRFTTFTDSFHGLAVRGGAVEVVNCASCHGAHAILRSDNPASSVHKANLARTCGQCHPRANQLFSVGSVHVSLAPKSAGAAGDGEPVIQLIASIYVWVIGLVVGGMLLHNALDFFKKVRGKAGRHFTDAQDEAVPHRLYPRMTVNERLQHGTLAISFVLLVVTGFMLRFPEAWWVVALRDIDAHLFELRGWMHRAAAVVMCASGAWHGWYIFGTARGRALIRDLWPRWSDVSDAWGVLRYNIGLTKTKPLFGRFSYIEKTEYWALLWGSILMTLTGVLLWASETTMSLVTKLGFDIARTVHYYEAILATLAIIVWHFYAVIFNPDVYPMNLSWLTGKLSEKEMLHEHPLELEKLKKEEASADASAPRDPEPPPEAPQKPDPK